MFKKEESSHIASVCLAICYKKKKERKKTNLMLRIEFSTVTMLLTVNLEQIGHAYLFFVFCLFNGVFPLVLQPSVKLSVCRGQRGESQCILSSHSYSDYEHFTCFVYLFVCFFFFFFSRLHLISQFVSLKR